jgi:hypothetical protein
LRVKTFLLNCILHRKITPSNLACKNLGLRGGVIVSCQPGYSKTLDYFKYQDFIIEFAGGSQQIFDGLFPEIRRGMRDFITDDFIKMAIDGLSIPLHENPLFSKIMRDIATRAHLVYKTIQNGLRLQQCHPDVFSRGCNVATEIIKASVREAFANNLPLLNEVVSVVWTETSDFLVTKPLKIGPFEFRAKA